MCMVAAAAVLAGWGAQPLAQTAPRTMVCMFPWCPVYVQVVPNASGAPTGVIQWDEVRMMRKLSDGTLSWNLVASPEYEFRANSVVATGTNATGASTQFPVRLISANQFALDNLNTNDLTYTYEVRVFKKGAPPNTDPVIVRGTIVNVYN
jgi:hypothetical protein